VHLRVSIREVALSSSPYPARHLYRGRRGWGRVMELTRGLGHLSLARLLRCALLRIAQLRVLQTERAEHTAGSSNDVLDAALLLAAPAAAMCLTVRCATCKGGLGAAHVLAPSSAAMRDAVLRAASSCRDAALVLAPPAAAMRDAVLVPPSAPLRQPSCWHRPPPSCATQ
jgi:ferredoxin